MQGPLHEATAASESVCQPCLTVNLVRDDPIDYYRSKPLSPGPIDVIVSRCKGRPSANLWVQLIPEPRGKKDTTARLVVATVVGDDLVFELDQVKRGPNHKLLIDQPDTKSYHPAWDQRIAAKLYDGDELLCEALSDPIRVSRERSRAYAKERKKRQHGAPGFDSKGQHSRLALHRCAHAHTYTRKLCARISTRPCTCILAPYSHQHILASAHARMSTPLASAHARISTLECMHISTCTRTRRVHDRSRSHPPASD